MRQKSFFTVKEINRYHKCKYKIDNKSCGIAHRIGKNSFRPGIPENLRHHYFRKYGFFGFSPEKWIFIHC